MGNTGNPQNGFNQPLAQHRNMQNTNKEFAISFVRSNADLNERGLFHNFFKPNLLDKIKLKKAMQKNLEFEMLIEKSIFPEDGVFEMIFQHSSALQVIVLYDCHFRSDKIGPVVVSKLPDAAQTLHIPQDKGPSKITLKIPESLMKKVTAMTFPKTNHFPILVSTKLEKNNSVTFPDFELFYVIRKKQCQTGFYVSEEYVRKNDRIFILSDVFGVSNETIGDSTSVALKNSKDADAKTCIICFHKKVNCLLVPCRHYSLCFACSKALQNSTNKCPICRETIREIVKIYKKKKEN